VDLIRESNDRLRLIGDALDHHERYSDAYLAELVGVRLAESKARIEERIEGGEVRRVRPVEPEPEPVIEPENPIESGGRER
jgi:hypothetical protein